MESQKAWNPLTEKEKLEIIKLAESPSTYHQWKFIGESIQRSPDTCKKFYKSYLTNGTIFPKQGRPLKVTDSIKQSVVDSMRRDPTQSLQDVSIPNNISKPVAKQILNENNIKFYKMTPVPPLDESHKAERITLCDLILSYQYAQLPPIIFTDESTICEDLDRGCIWRERGHHPPESFLETIAKIN